MDNVKEDRIIFKKICRVAHMIDSSFLPILHFPFQKKWKILF